VSDFTAEHNGAHQHRRCSRRRGRRASRRGSDARRGSPKAHSRLPATPGPRAGVRRQRSAVLVGPGGSVHAIGDAPPARVGDSRSARVRTSAPILASSTASTSPTAGGGSLSRLAVRRRPLTAICSNSRLPRRSTPSSTPSSATVSLGPEDSRYSTTARVLKRRKQLRDNPVHNRTQDWTSLPPGPRARTRLRLAHASPLGYDSPHHALSCPGGSGPRGLRT
jgi:hypothetical protein